MQLRMKYYISTDNSKLEGRDEYAIFEISELDLIIA